MAADGRHPQPMKLLTFDSGTKQLLAHAQERSNRVTALRS
jgi:hypothetical protein